MAHQEIIDSALRIIRNKLNEADDTVTISKQELTKISTALAVASVLCRANDERNGR